MPSGYARAAIESTPGNETNTPTLSTKKLFPPLISLGPHPGTNPMERDDELRNQDEPLPVLSEAYNPTWDVSVRAYPDVTAFLLQLACGAPTTTAGNGVITDTGGAIVPTGAFRHRWTAPFGPSGVTPLTAQLDIAYVDQSTYYKAKGAACADFSVTSPEAGGVQVAASGPALYLDRQANPALSPTYESLSVRPFTRGNLSFPTFGPAGAAASVEDFTWQINNPVEPYRSLGVRSNWPDVMEKANAGPIAVSGTIPKRQLDPDDVDALKNATGFALIASWVSESIIAASYPYKLFLSLSNAQYVDGDPTPLANQRRHGHSLSWKSTTPSSGSTVIEIVNATSSYA